MARLERREDRAEPVISGVALGADADGPLAVPGEPPHVVFGALHFAEHAPRRFEDAAPRLGQYHAPPESGEERRPEPPFDIAQLMTERGLREMQLPRRLRHAAGVGDPRHEPQMPDLEVHGADPST